MLTGLSVFWFDRTADIVPDHFFVTEGVPEEVARPRDGVRKLEMLPVECVVRGYLTGSGWKEYQAERRVCGIELPAGLRESDQLPEPIFTPATKADVGHDEAIDFDGAARAGRRPGPRRARCASLDRRLRARGRARAASAGSSSPTRSSSSASTRTAS